MHLTFEQQLGAILLYQDKIECLLDSELLEKFESLLDVEDRASYKAQFTLNGVTLDLKSRLMHSLFNSPLKGKLYSNLLEILSERDSVLHEKLLGFRVFDPLHYGLVLSKATTIISNFDPIMMSCCLFSIDICYGNLCSKVELIENEKYRMPFLLREIPFVSSDWYWHLFEALGENNREIRDILHPNFEKDYDIEKQLKDQVSTKVLFIGTYDPIDLESARIVDLAREHLPMEKNSCASRPDTSYCGVDAEDDDSAVEELKLRAYQEELATPALQLKNTIICAPTGSGKTIVAIRIIEQHLFLGRRNSQKRKVIFLVPTVPLVNQQTEKVRCYLRDRWRIRGLSGGEYKIPPSVTVQNSDVVVMTPQLLVNLMKMDEQEERLNLWDFSLLLLDECHHTNESHPYNVAMQEYQDHTSTKALPPDCKLPQVVGLTASLGVGGGSTIAEAAEHMILMSANHCVHKLSCVMVHKDDLLKYVNIPIDAIEKIRSTHLTEPFYLIITEMMRKIEEKIIPILSRLTIGGKPEGEAANVPMPRHQQKYESWFSTLLESKVPKSDLPGEEKRHVTSCLEHIKMYAKSLELHAHLPTDRAFRNVSKTVPNLIAGCHSVWDKWLEKLWKDNQLRLKDSISASHNDLYHRLCSCLKEEYKKQPEARTIVFVRTRELTVELKNLINAHPELREFGGGYLTSINTSKDTGGQAQSDQKKELMQFQDGTTKILFATTVAEEGLDIQQCSLVIKYNHATNEIAMMQRRGRGRAAGSRSILLAQEDWIAEKEAINKEREKLMNETLKRIHEMGDEKFSKLVKEKTMELIEERHLKRILNEKERQRLAGCAKKYNLICKKCNELICRASFVRLVADAHYVCVDPEIWSRAQPHPTPDPKVFATMSIIGWTNCRNCQHMWGSVIKYREVLLPVVGAPGAVLEPLDDTGKRNKKVELTSFKKWKKVKGVYFNVDGIEDIDLKRMSDKLRQLKSI